ncbi:heterokaryon incompatibility protein-domain-containing protein [Xylariales sp. PMI_506]|nr:heterokaryon incompatibility protein-domain-containing protein [Xylariales sp. PMI_506]
MADKDQSRFKAVNRTTESLCSACQAIFTKPLTTTPTPEAPRSGAAPSPWDIREDLTSDQPERAYFAQGLHHATAIECYAASCSGCPICHTVWLRATNHGAVDVLGISLEGDFSTWTVKLNGTGVYAHPNWPADLLILSISVGSISKAKGQGILHIFANDQVVFGLDPIPNKDLVNGPVAPEAQHDHDLARSADLLSHSIVSDTTWSNETWNKIITWIDRCRHDCKCLWDLGSDAWNYAPSRLIDVGENGDTVVHLRVKAEIGNPAPYIALSYCWGGVEGHRLYDKNIQWDNGPSTEDIEYESARNGIIVESLPKTFRDAIQITRRLGVRYLWVDSLCIIQNSWEDWEPAAKSMLSVYSMAYLTFAADGSKDSKGGLGLNRKPSLANPVVLAPEWDKEILHGHDTFVLIPADFWKHLVSESFVGRRSWTLQERYLSRVVIHFGLTQVAFECCHSEYCETFPSGLPKSLLEDSHARFKSREPEKEGHRLRELHADANMDDDEADDRSLDAYYLWSRMIEKYTQAGITRDADKLIAIYGLGSFMTHFFFQYQDTYLGGAWYNILPSQLIWSVDTGYKSAVINSDGRSRNSFIPPATRPQKRNAPTWSWASVRGPVLMPKPLRRGSLVEITVSGHNKEDMGHHQNVLLVVGGSLHYGFVFWSPHFDKWMVAMRKDGFGRDLRSVTQPHPPAQSANAQKGGDDSADPGDSASARNSPLYTYEQEVQFEEAQDLYIKSVHALASNINYRLSDVNRSDYVIGMGQPDTYDDVSIANHGRQPRVVVFLPVINTRRCGKYALHPRHVDGTGISGLLLVPADPRFPGFYNRLGVFHLPPDFNQSELRIRRPEEVHYQLLFSRLHEGHVVLT